MELFLQICGVLGLLVSIASIVVARRANKEARTANSISAKSNQIAQDSNRISAESNQIAHRVERMQLADTEVRIVVQPRMHVVVHSESDRRPRPVVRVINLSRFPVTLRTIAWKIDHPETPEFTWEDPRTEDSWVRLPLRMEPRTAAILVGNSDWLPGSVPLDAIRACVARTDCEEAFEGMSDQWLNAVRRMTAKAEGLGGSGATAGGSGG